MGYRAAWDTVPRGIPCRVGYRAAARYHAGWAGAGAYEFLMQKLVRFDVASLADYAVDLPMPLLT